VKFLKYFVLLPESFSVNRLAPSALNLMSFSKVMSANSPHLILQTPERVTPSAAKFLLPFPACVVHNLFINFYLGIIAPTITKINRKFNKILQHIIFFLQKFLVIFNIFRRIKAYSETAKKLSCKL